MKHTQDDPRWLQRARKRWPKDPPPFGARMLSQVALPLLGACSNGRQERQAAAARRRGAGSQSGDGCMPKDRTRSKNYKPSHKLPPFRAGCVVLRQAFASRLDFEFA